jgi:hypothetical protein
LKEIPYLPNNRFKIKREGEKSKAHGSESISVLRVPSHTTGTKKVGEERGSSFLLKYSFSSVLLVFLLPNSSAEPIICSDILSHYVLLLLC